MNAAWAIMRKLRCQMVRLTGFLQGENEAHQLFGSVRDGNIVMLALRPFFGEVSGKNRIPMANVLGGVENGKSEIAGAALFHMGIAVFKLPGLVS